MWTGSTVLHMIYRQVVQGYKAHVDTVTDSTMLHIFLDILTCSTGLHYT